MIIPGGVLFYVFAVTPAISLQIVVIGKFCITWPAEEGRTPFFLLSAINMASAQSEGKPQSQRPRGKSHSKPRLSAVLAHHKPRSARLAGPRTGRRQPVIAQVVSDGKSTGALFLRIQYAPRKGAKKCEMKTARSTNGYPGYTRA